ncbi:MAG: peptidyl-prolyl cis-trans isomerase, partial [Rhodospirillales bacterium]|nr:peptidyl-prolyl cis-trans isomerase [Rhodospirillales bacterium]
DELAKEIKVSEKQIKESFEQRAEEFFAPERRKLQQIILTDEAEAKKAEAMLSDGKPFVEVAKELANMDEKSIDLGLIAKEELFPELKDAVFALTAGANSTPLKSPIGWHILKVVSIETARQQTLDDVRVKLTQDIAKEMALDGLYELANKLEDSLGGGASLEEAARSLGLPVTRIPSIDGGGRNADGQPVDGLPKGWDYLNIAFSTPEGSESALTEVGNKGYYILRVDSVKAPALKPLDKVRSIVVNDWKADTRNKSSEKTAKILLDRINKGEDLFKVATEMKLKVTTSAPFTRSPNSATGDLPLTVIESLFKLKEGQATMGSAGQGYVVARMKEIRSADPAQGKEDFKKLKSTILQSLQNDLVSQLISALRTRHPVSVNQRAIEQLF